MRKIIFIIGLMIIGQMVFADAAGVDLSFIKISGDLIRTVDSIENKDRDIKQLEQAINDIRNLYIEKGAALKEVDRFLAE